jgi:FixJ family two-component response regulator
MRKRRAIIVDDEEIIVQMLTNFFSARNYEVLAFNRAVVCPIQDKNERPCSTGYPCADVLITDFSMPGKNGLEMLAEQEQQGCKLIKENKAVMSGFIDDEHYRQIKSLGYAFFQKPFDFSVFSAWLDACETRMNLSDPLATRRKEIRHAIHQYNVQCLVDLTNELVNGKVVNVSTDGLCLQLDAPLMRKHKIHIDTLHPGLSCRTASVQWVTRNQDGSYLTGLSCLHKLNPPVA